MEYAVWTASSDSEDATTELDEEEGTPSNADFEVICKQNARRSAVQRKKRHFAEDGKDQGAKLVKITEQHQKNQMESACTEWEESASDPSRCQWSESMQASHLEENYAAKEPVNCTQSTNLVHPPQEMHTREAKYNCPECNITCNNSLQLNHHLILGHHIVKACMCPECNKHFATADGMSGHRLQFHKVEKPYQCSDCNTAFYSCFLRNKHWRQYHKLELLKCPECNQSRQNPESLVDHWLAMHNAEKCFQCPKCDFKFTTLSRLSKHSLTHLNHEVSQAQNII